MNIWILSLKRRKINKQMFNLMKRGSLLVISYFILVLGFISCKKTYSEQISYAELIAEQFPDSALSILEQIDPSELKVDSTKAKYHFLIASIHDKQERILSSDSLIRFSVEYYKDKNLGMAIRSATLSALYDYSIGNSKEAIYKLDSLVKIPSLPDSLVIYPLRKRAFLGTKIFEERKNRKNITRLISIEKDSERKDLYKLWLHLDYLFNGEKDSALIILDELIERSKLKGDRLKEFDYEYEKIGVLEEMGNYSESLELADKLLKEPQSISLKHYIYLWKSMALFNSGERGKAKKELTKADSCTLEISDPEKGYYNIFSHLLKSAIDYDETGELNLLQMALVNNSQKDNWFRIQSIQQESEQSALKLENKRLILKAKNEKQTSIIIIIVLGGLLISGLSIWYALNKRRKTIEAEEKAEVLNKMIEELKQSSSISLDRNALRRTMLQHIGIIKMVAETPTEQNRKMLQKISSIESDTKGSLINWENLFEIIDNLYAGFYSNLHRIYGNLLTEKEEQIIILMLAGFSTKEISVITGLTTSTIYVRKSSIRKKIGLTEKQDIIGFFRSIISN